MSYLEIDLVHSLRKFKKVLKQVKDNLSSFISEGNDHDHNDLYYTETEINSLLSSKSDNDHEHNELYYSEVEVDNLLTTKAAVTHKHDEDYANLEHDHDTVYSQLGHDHDAEYSLLGHNHDADYASISHSHSDLFTAVYSTSIKHYNDDYHGILTTTYTKLKETLVNVSGTVNIYWECKRANTTSITVYSKLYINGSPVGSEQTTTSTTYVQFSETNVSINEGDLVQIYIKGSSDLCTSYVRNLRLGYELVYVDFGTSQDP